MPITRKTLPPLAARILLGALFTLSGISGFAMLFIPPPPPMAGLAGDFFKPYFASHWLQFVDGMQLISGVLFLANRYVPLALVISGAILANIIVFHITMMPSGIVPGLIATALWIVLARQHEAFFRVLFSADGK